MLPASPTRASPANGPRRRNQKRTSRRQRWPQGCLSLSAAKPLPLAESASVQQHPEEQAAPFRPPSLLPPFQVEISS